MSLVSDLAFWEESEDVVATQLKELGFQTVEKTSKTALLDYRLTKGRKTYYAELKTRKCSHSQYPDTMIGANKLWEAWNLYYKEWIETLFLFKFTDWLFLYNPLEVYRREFKAWRWGRGFKKDWSPIDWKKGWIYINTNNLKDEI